MMGRNGAGARASALARGGALLVGLICLGTTGALEASRALSAHRYDGLAAKHEEVSSGALNDEQPTVSYAAWLTVEGTPIDLPVAVVADGMPADFYLSHDLWGNRSALGCPYLDERCSEDGMHILVYGHRIGWTDEVFTPLADCYHQQRFDALGQARWESSDGAATVFHPLCALRVSASFAAIQRFSFDDLDDLRSWLNGIAAQADARVSDWEERIARTGRVLTLVTCSEANGHSATRTLVIFVANTPASTRQATALPFWETGLEHPDCR